MRPEEAGSHGRRGRRLRRVLRDLHQEASGGARPPVRVPAAAVVPGLGPTMLPAAADEAEQGAPASEDEWEGAPSDAPRRDAAEV